ncbi:MAG: hypothetical protein M3319_13055 [Actinomycetota bacterium]|nr:hypothetical protein [Actinomycetota bacterium]
MSGCAARSDQPGVNYLHDLAELLLANLRNVLPRLSHQPSPQRGIESSSFSHGASRPRHHLVR